ncbi:MAG: DNA primase [Clostridia bacterium]|nr:DNA primase [Clostridia bacterium]
MPTYGKFPERWVEEVRQRADLVQIVSSYVPLKKKGRKYWGLCPFHGEKTASFSVDPEAQLYYCFGCKAGGSVIRFVMDMEHLSYPETMHYLADRLHMPTPQMEEDPEYHIRKSQRERLLGANLEAARFYHQLLYSPQGAASLEYLHGRGIDDSVIRRFGLGAAPDSWDALLKHLTELGYTEQELRLAGLIVVHEAEPATESSPARPRRAFDMFRNRAIFPIIDARGNILGFGGRILGKGEPKYLNTSDTPVFNKRLGVYAANLLQKERNLDRVILVEGYMDVIALRQFGVPGVVATLGTAFTPEQAQYLKRYAPRVYLAYDGDSAGQHAILRGLNILGDAGIPARVLDFPDGLDPDEFIRRDGKEGFDQLPAVSPETYRLRRIRDTLDLTTKEGRTEYAKQAGPILKGLEPVELENQLQDLMLQTGFSREVLIAQIQVSPTLAPASPVSSPHRNIGIVQPKASLPGQEVSEALRSEEQMISLLATGKVPYEDIVTEEDFTDPFLQKLFRLLISGRSPASVVEMLESAEEVQRASLLMMSPQAEDVNEMLQMAHQAMRRIRLARVDRERTALEKQMRELPENERPQLLPKLLALQKERDSILKQK